MRAMMAMMAFSCVAFAGRQVRSSVIVWGAVPNGAGTMVQ